MTAQRATVAATAATTAAHGGQPTSIAGPLLLAPREPLFLCALLLRQLLLQLLFPLRPSLAPTLRGTLLVLVLVLRGVPCQADPVIAGAAAPAFHVRL